MVPFDVKRSLLLQLGTDFAAAFRYVCILIALFMTFPSPFLRASMVARRRLIGFVRVKNLHCDLRERSVAEIKPGRANLHDIVLP